MNKSSSLPTAAAAIPTITTALKNEDNASVNPLNASTPSSPKIFLIKPSVALYASYPIFKNVPNASTANITKSASHSIPVAIALIIPSSFGA